VAVGEADQARRADRALADGDDAAVAGLLKLLLVEDLHRQSGL
jgi:hypothetical protein